MSTVAIHIDGLIAKGYLRKRDHSARSLEVVSTNVSASPKQASVSPAKEKWLVEAVNSRFAAYAQHPTQQTMDELYVLIGALKILGLDGAHEAVGVLRGLALAGGRDDEDAHGARLQVGLLELLQAGQLCLHAVGWRFLADDARDLLGVAGDGAVQHVARPGLRHCALGAGGSLGCSSCCAVVWCRCAAAELCSCVRNRSRGGDDPP